MQMQTEKVVTKPMKVTAQRVIFILFYSPSSSVCSFRNVGDFYEAADSNGVDWGVIYGFDIVLEDGKVSFNGLDGDALVH